MNVEICDKPIFVLGPPRSGTSMMQWALRQHPDLWGGEESDFLVPLLRNLERSYEHGLKRGDKHWLARQEVSYEEYLRLDTTMLSPDEAAVRIQEHFGL